jgi:hypothetical protein
MHLPSYRLKRVFKKKKYLKRLPSLKRVTYSYRLKVEREKQE